MVKGELELFASWSGRCCPLYLTYKCLPKASGKAEGKSALPGLTHQVQPSDSSQTSRPRQRSSSEAALSSEASAEPVLRFPSWDPGGSLGARGSGKYRPGHCAVKSCCAHFELCGPGLEDGPARWVPAPRWPSLTS